jgi:phage tail-like protein
MANDVKILGKQRELFPKHQFLVEVRDGWWAGFQKCSELSYEVAKIEYWEGGSVIPWKVPGRATMTDVTLERGASTSRKFYDWALQVVNASVGGFNKATRGVGSNHSVYLEDVDIIQLDRDGVSEKRVWTLFNVWVQKFIAGDWDNTADEVVIEQLILTYDWFEIGEALA